MIPKDKGKKTRLIFHLSYPRNGDSVNSGISKEKCLVKYPDFSEAVKLCIQAGKGCSTAKSDMSRAFRNILLRKSCWQWLVMMAVHPVTGKKYYFVDKCLPFGSSISCAIFQEVSNAVAHVVSFETGEVVINYLDDYPFAAYVKAWCDDQVKVFLSVCQHINFPVTLEKTFWGCTSLTFLDMLLDTINQVIGLPVDKVVKALELVRSFLSKKKATVLEFQKLCGYLNFICRAVVPGRVFLRRLHSKVHSRLLPHHHVSINKENKMDLMVWEQFLLHPGIFTRPFIDCLELDANSP